ncbi:hypothetical protein T484DRAFT_1768738 [Baffinella frigidus]|nr:hypothetical protein T484DRAFT_1768738 [Cryptophyta sp. CCMP2293]
MPAGSKAISAFGGGSGNIWMDDVDCAGDESLLTWCPYHDIHNCVHDEDVGIDCVGTSLTCSLVTVSG